jgi:oligopeptide transport system substrate-binding protein
MRSGKKFTLGFLPTLFALISMLVAGCGAGGSTPSTAVPTAAPKSQQVYRVGILGSDIKTFDPAITTDINSATAINAVFTGLVSLNDKLEVQPQLAKSLPTVSTDGLTYTFTLKPNLHFSDGTSLTATDVVYSLDRALSPDVSSLNGVTLTYLGLIKDATDRTTGKVASLINDSLFVVDPNTVKIIVSQKTAYFLEALTYSSSFVVEKSVIDKWGTKWTDHLSDNGGQGGDGPWKVLSYSHTTGIDLVPNTFYYGKAQTLQHLNFIFYKSLETMYSAYFANQLDYTGVPSSDDAQAEARTQEFHKNSQLSLFYIAMNYLYKPFDNIDIREAFSLALNRDTIAKDIYNGLVAPSCHIIPNGMPGYNPNLKCAGGASTTGDKALAQQLFAKGLAAEGLTKATFPSITITYPNSPQDTANEIALEISMWSNVLGVTINPHAEDFNQLLSDVNNTVCQTPTDLSKCQNKGLAMWWLGWIGDYPDPQDWTTLQFAKGSANNAWNYGQNLSTVASNQQAVQSELVDADADLGSDRISKYDDAEMKLVNDVAWLTIDQSQGVALIKSYIYGVMPNAQGLTPPDDWANIYVSAH